MPEQTPSTIEQVPTPAGRVARRGLLGAAAALAGAAVARLVGADDARGSHDTNVAYDSQTVMHVDVTNTTSGSTRIRSSIFSTAAFVALNNVDVGISRADAILGRTSFTSANAAGVAGTNEAVSGGVGVLGAASAANGVGVYGAANTNVPSEIAPGGTGVFGRGPSRGVVGRSTGGVGVQGESVQSNGVEGSSTSGAGVSGSSESGVGVLGAAGAGGVAGRFVGATVVEGPLTAQSAQVTGAVGVTGEAAVGALRVTGAASLGPAASADKLSLPKTSGVVKLKRAASSVRISNLPIGASTIAIATLQQARSGLYVRAAVPSRTGRRLTIYFNKRAPRGTKVAWLLIN